MGLGKSCILPPDTEQTNTAETDARYNASAPVRMMTHDQSQQASDALFPTGSHFHVSQKTDREVKRPKPVGRHMILHTFDNKKENASKDLDERQIFDVPNRDHKKPSKRKKKNKSQPVEIRDADNIKIAESNESHAASSSNDMNIVHEYKRNVKRLESRVSQLIAEKDGLLNRLIEIGAMKLTERNPNITDLGDPNRPQKVVEEFSEIYDNEWTDAYEYLTRKRKENTDVSAKTLLMILQEVFTICMSSTEKKTRALKKALVNYVGLTKEDQDELELMEIEKRIRDYRRKKLRKYFKRTVEEVGNQLKRVFTKETCDDVSEYIGSCVGICCKMCTNEPPMYLDFGDSIKPAQSRNKTATKMHFDKAKFMCYTKSGDYIDYVIWPAVYLFKDGPLMKKGVAQGTQEYEEYKDVSD